MLILTSLRSPSYSPTIRSSTGATAWHGPHHSAQKSTSTGSPAWSTSFSNVASVTSVAIQRSFRFLVGGPVPDRPRERTLLSTLRFPMSAQVFQTLPTVPDHPALEELILERWDREETFRKLREQNAGGP